MRGASANPSMTQRSEERLQDRRAVWRWCTPISDTRCTCRTKDDETRIRNDRRSRWRSHQRKPLVIQPIPSQRSAPYPWMR